MSKEVTLRQCETCFYCDKSIKIQDILWGDCVEDPGSYCLKCTIKIVNEQKKQAGDKTEFVLIEKPRDQRLGETIMRACPMDFAATQNKAFATEYWEIGSDDFIEEMVETGKIKLWDIWEQDPPDIQEKINKLNK